MTASTPELEVCVIFFNRAAQTIECLDSLRGAPTYVLDNGSAVAARQRVERHCANLDWVTLIDSEENLGCARGRNLLVSKTHAPWLLFLDNDVVVSTPDWRDRFARHVARHPDAEVLLPRMYNVHHGNYWPRFKLVFRDGRAVREPNDQETTNLFSGGGSFIRRALFERLGGYDPQMEGFEDWDLVFGAVRAGAPAHCRYIDDIELRHEHRLAETPEDQATALIRYAPGAPARLRALILERHGVLYDEDRRWEAGHELHRGIILGDTSPQSSK